MNLLDQSLGQLAGSIPGAAGLFHKYQLDFCSGANQSLREAATRHAVDLQSLTAELSALQAVAPEKIWRDTPNTELIEHILTRYHDIHRQQLPELIRLAQRVELVHGSHPACPVGLTSLLEQMLSQLETHMQKEETILFPMIARGMKGVAMHPVAIMRQQHQDHGSLLVKMEHRTHGMVPPDDACNTWRALYLGLETFKADLLDHVCLENDVLFDRIDNSLGEIQHG